jgi:hypothetical protein
MQEQAKRQIADVLKNYSLYRSKTIDLPFDQFEDWDDLTFLYYCELDESEQTFQLQMEPERLVGHAPRWGLFSQSKVSNPTIENYNGGTLRASHYSAVCQHCKNYKAHFLLLKEAVRFEEPNPKVFSSYQFKVKLTKIGQKPAFEIKADKEILRFLSDDDKENYKKALMCKSQGYGIAACAYLRRVLEKEVFRMIEAVAEFDRPESEKIKLLIGLYHANHQMAPLIEGLTQYLPNSFKALGDNPIKALYEQLSIGLHESTEDECKEKAESIDTVLKFVIKKINEENSEVKTARLALQALRKEATT